MKKLFITLSIAVLCAPFISAQENIFKVDDKVVNLGLGIGSTFYTGRYYKSSVPPLSVSFEKGIKDEVLEKGVIGVGGYLGYSAYKYQVLEWGWKYTTIILGARGSFHYPLVDNIDTYTGILIGYQIVSSKEFGTFTSGLNNSAAGSRVIWSWYAGGRYYFSEKMAVMAEIGYGITYLNLGVALNL